MFSFQKRIAAVLAVTAALSLALTSCTGAKSYSSPESLIAAYTNAGGVCEDQVKAPESMVSEGAHGIFCMPSMTFMVVFNTEDHKNRYIARTGDHDGYRVAGDRWIVSGEKGDANILDQLGGKKIS